MRSSATLIADFFDSSTWDTARNAALLTAVVVWLSTAYWVFTDARRRIEDPWLIALATLLGLVPPFVGPLIYLFLRPPEYLEDARERELEIRAMEEQLADTSQRCPVCRARVDPSFLICPVCTTRLKQSCSSCGQALDALWQVCPYCATPVPPSLPALEDVSAPPPPRRSAGER
jgi:hypothetical protein